MIIIEDKFNIPRTNGDLSDVEVIPCLINACITLDKATAASFNNVLSVNDIFPFIAFIVRLKYVNS